MAKRHHVREAADAQLRRIGSDIESFLRAGLERGESPETMARSLYATTGLDVSWRSLYRWIDDLNIEVGS